MPGDDSTDQIRLTLGLTALATPSVPSRSAITALTSVNGNSVAHGKPSVSSEVAVRSPIAEVRWTTLVPSQFIYRIYLVKADCASERHSRTAGLASSVVDQATRPAKSCHKGVLRCASAAGPPRVTAGER